MFPNQEQISVSTRSYFESQLAMMVSLTNKTLESVEKLVDLTLSTARNSMEESGQVTKQLLAARGPQEILSLTTARAQPNVDKLLTFGRQVTDIASAAQSEFSKAAEAQLTEANRKIVKIVEDVSKSAPTVSENMVAVVKSSFENAGENFDQANKTGKQGIEAMEANINSVNKQVAQASTKQNGGTH